MSDKERITTINVTMKLDVDSICAKTIIKMFDHHIETLFDLDSWPEIRSIHDCNATIESNDISSNR